MRWEERGRGFPPPTHHGTFSFLRPPAQTWKLYDRRNDTALVLFDQHPGIADLSIQPNTTAYVRQGESMTQARH